eukprot:gene4328-30698_t
MPAALFAGILLAAMLLLLLVPTVAPHVDPFCQSRCKQRARGQGNTKRTVHVLRADDEGEQRCNQSDGATVLNQMAYDQMTMFPYSFGVKTRYDTNKVVDSEYKSPGMPQGVHSRAKATHPKVWAQFVQGLPPASGGAVLIQALRVMHETARSPMKPVPKVDAAEVLAKLHQGRAQGLPCVIGWTPFMGDGLGAQLARAIEHNISGTILGCITKCAPIPTLFAETAVFSHQPDGATLYCHITGRPLKAASKVIKELKTKYISVDASSPEHQLKAEERRLGSVVNQLPQSYVNSLACARIPHFSEQVAEIAPCISPQDYGRGVHAYLTRTTGTGLAINKLVDAVLELPPEQRVAATARVEDAFNVLRSTRQNNAVSRQAQCGSGPAFPASHDAAAIVVAVHIRAGDHFKTKPVKLEICFLHWMLAMFRKHLPQKKVRVHVHTETSEPVPNADGQFAELSDFLTFPPSTPSQLRPKISEGQSSLPSWCGASARPFSSPPTAEGAVHTVSDRFVGRLNAIGGYPSTENVVLHPNGNPLESILCIADADVILEGTSSSFVNIAKLLSRAVKVRPHDPNELHEGNLRHRTERMMQLVLGLQPHLEFSAVEKAWWYGPNHTSPDFNTAKACPELNMNASTFVRHFLAAQREIHASKTSPNNS